MTSHPPVQANINGGTPLPKSTKIAYFLIATGLVVLLLIARVMKPSPEGMGTHQQLGLPPCTMLYLTGLPCPSCGMTTSWAHTLRGEITEAVQANLAGVLLCIQAIATAPFLFWTVARGRSSASGWGSKVSLGLVLSIVCLSVVQWVVRLTGI